MRRQKRPLGRRRLPPSVLLTRLAAFAAAAEALTTHKPTAAVETPVPTAFAAAVGLLPPPLAAVVSSRSTGRDRRRVGAGSGGGSLVRPRTGLAVTPSDLAEDYAKWDNLSDDDEEEDESAPSDRIKIPPDMRYEIRNIHRQSANYDAIRAAGGRDVVRDVYLRSPGDEVAWLVGRVASVSDVSPARAIDRQYPLIERHGWAIRPVDLHPRRGPFEVWYTAAAGEADAEVTACSPSVRFRKVQREDLLVGEGTKQEVMAVEVGFRGISYDDDDDDDDIGMGGGAIGARLTEDGRIVKGTLDDEEQAAGAEMTEEDMANTLDKIQTAPSLEDLLGDADFQDLVDRQ